LVKRFFQMKAIKQIADLGDSRTPAMIEVAPILESDPAFKEPMEERKKKNNHR
jgi:hypothetical protein